MMNSKKTESIIVLVVPILILAGSRSVKVQSLVGIRYNFSKIIDFLKHKINRIAVVIIYRNFDCYAKLSPTVCNPGQTKHVYDNRYKYSIFNRQYSITAYPGRVIVMVQPGPSLLAAATDPPISRTNFFTRARPIPVPRVVRVSEFSTR